MEKSSRIDVEPSLFHTLCPKHTETPAALRALAHQVIAISRNGANEKNSGDRLVADLLTGLWREWRDCSDCHPTTPPTLHSIDLQGLREAAKREDIRLAAKRKPKLHLRVNIPCNRHSSNPERMDALLIAVDALPPRKSPAEPARPDEIQLAELMVEMRDCADCQRKSKAALGADDDLGKRLTETAAEIDDVYAQFDKTSASPKPDPAAE